MITETEIDTMVDGLAARAGGRRPALNRRCRPQRLNLGMAPQNRERETRLQDGRERRRIPGNPGRTLTLDVAPRRI